MTTDKREPATPLDVTLATIEQYRGGKLGRIVRDLDTLGLPQDETFRVLLARGVGQAFQNRHDLFWTAEIIKDELTRLQAGQRLHKETMTPLYPLIQELRRQERDTWTAEDRALWKAWLSLQRDYMRAKGSIRSLRWLYGLVVSMTRMDRWRVPSNDDTGFKLYQELTEATEADTTVREQYRFESHRRRHRAWQKREANRFRVEAPLLLEPDLVPV
jgi:hypothetical protein